MLSTPAELVRAASRASAEPMHRAVTLRLEESQVLEAQPGALCLEVPQEEQAEAAVVERLLEVFQAEEVREAQQHREARQHREASMRYMHDSVSRPDGGIYFAQAEDIPLRVLTPGGRIETVLGLGPDTTGSLAGATSGLVIQALTYGPGDKLYFTRSTSCTIRVIDFAAQTVSTVAGSTCERSTVVNGTLATARFGDVRRMGMVRQAGHQVLFVGQCDQGLIRTVNLTTGVVSTLAGVLNTFDPNAATDGPPGTGLLASRCTEFVDDGFGGAYFGNAVRLRHVDAAGNLRTLAVVPPPNIEAIALEGTRLYFYAPYGVFSVDLTAPSTYRTDYRAFGGYRDGLAGGMFGAYGLELTPTEFIIPDYYRFRRIWR